MVESQASLPGWRGLSGAADFSWDLPPPHLGSVAASPSLTAQMALTGNDGPWQSEVKSTEDPAWQNCFRQQ